MKKKILATLGAVMVLMLAIVPAVSAAEVTVPDVGGTLESAFTGVINNIISTATSILPIALSVMGISLTVTFGIKFFKRVTGRSA